MRLIALSIFALCVGFAQAQKTQGTYQPDPKTSESWSINDHLTLIWNGKPYLPVGTVADSAADVERATAAGIHDFIVDLPASGAGWNETLGALNKHNATYLLRINSLAPMATGVAVEPQGYRVAGITATQTVHVSLPGIQQALIVVALRRDGSIVESKRLNVDNGVLTYTVQAPEGLERVLLIYPITSSAELPDYWEGLDKHRDDLLETLKQHNPGPGLRGIVDPFGRTLVLPGKELRFVPISPYFHDELRDFLLDKYKALETAERNWAMGSNDIADFDALARLIPLWSGQRGVSDFWDPKTDKLYPCDNRRSRVWDDITMEVESAGARRYSRIVSDLHSVVDVPVVQQWAGWASAYETETPALDGIGMRTSGTAQVIVADAAGHAASSILRWKRPGWLPATDVDLGPGADPSQLPVVVGQVTSLGARGVFVRADTPAMLKAIGTAAAFASDPSLANSSPQAVFFPENAENPAQIERYPNGVWALPSPMDGNRVDLGSKYVAYQYVLGGKQIFAISALRPGRERLYMAKTTGISVSRVDGVDPKPRFEKGFLEVDLGTTPLIITGTDEIPVPEEAYKETVDRITRMALVLNQAHQDAPEALYQYQVANSEFKVSPGIGFGHMREAYHAMSFLLGKFDWIEAESSRDNNFSEIDASPACSGGQSLALRTQLPPGTEGYYASYVVPVRTNGDQEVWLAARIPPDRRGDVQVIIGGQSDAQGAAEGVLGGQTMTINTDPVSLYANGFGWYKLGVTRLAGGRSSLKVVVKGQISSDLALDVILLTPGAFVPNGVNLPDAMDFSKPLNTPKGKGRGSRGGGSS